MTTPSAASLSTRESDIRYAMRLFAEYCSGDLAPVLPVAFPAAEFPSLVPIAHKLLSALLAHQRIICFFIHFRLVRTPPPHPASVRTEPLFLPAFILYDCLPTLWADVGIPRPWMPPQVRLYCICRQVQHFRNRHSAFALLLQTADPAHIFIRHIKHLLIIRRFVGGFIHPPAQKYLPAAISVRFLIQKPAVYEPPHYTEIWRLFWIPMKEKKIVSNLIIFRVDNLRIQS